MRLYILMALLCATSHLAICQNQNKIDFEKYSGTEYQVILTLQVPNISYLDYPEKSKIDTRFEDESSVKISSLEDFVKAIYSANNRSWYNKYFANPDIISKSDRDLQSRAANNTGDPQNQVLLLSRLSTFTNGKQITLVKLQEVNAGKSGKPFTVTVEKTASGWLVIDKLSELNDLFYVVNLVQPQVLRKLFVNGSFKDPYLNSLRDKTRVKDSDNNENLDLAILIKEVKQLEDSKQLSVLQKISDQY
jgi:hypothetical protein